VEGTRESLRHSQRKANATIRLFDSIRDYSHSALEFANEWGLEATVDNGAAYPGLARCYAN